MTNNSSFSYCYSNSWDISFWPTLPSLELMTTLHTWDLLCRWPQVMWKATFHCFFYFDYIGGTLQYERSPKWGDSLRGKIQRQSWHRTCRSLLFRGTWLEFMGKKNNVWTAQRFMLHWHMVCDLIYFVDSLAACAGSHLNQICVISAALEPALHHIWIVAGVLMDQRLKWKYPASVLFTNEN